jgi:hypothetical protein
MHKESVALVRRDARFCNTPTWEHPVLFCRRRQNAAGSRCVHQHNSHPQSVPALDVRATIKHFYCWTCGYYFVIYLSYMGLGESDTSLSLLFRTQWMLILRFIHAATRIPAAAFTSIGLQMYSSAVVTPFAVRQNSSRRARYCAVTRVGRAGCIPHPTFGGRAVVTREIRSASSIARQHVSPSEYI